MDQRTQNRNAIIFWILIFAITFLITYRAASQTKEIEHYVSFSTGVDIRNAIVGSGQTNHKPALDLLYQFSMVSKKTEINIGYERFQKIGFEKLTFGLGYHFPLYGYAFGKEINTEIIPSLEPTLIGRWGDQWGTTSSHLTIGANLAFRVNLSKNIAVEFSSNFLPRSDLSARYPELYSKAPVIVSNYLKLVCKI